MKEKGNQRRKRKSNRKDLKKIKKKKNNKKISFEQRHYSTSYLRYYWKTFQELLKILKEKVLSLKIDFH